MKIVHLLGWYFPDSIGGTEIYVAELCRRLRAAGHTVSVAAPITTGAAPLHYRHDGVEVFRYRIPQDATRDEACNRRAVRGADALYRWLDECRPDLVHVHSFTTGVGIHEIRHARRLGARVIATCHLPGFGYMCRAGELMQWGSEPCDGMVVTAKCAECNLVRVGVPRLAARTLGVIPPSLSASLGRLSGPVGTAFGMAGSVVHHQRMQRDLLSCVDGLVVLNETAKRMLLANGSDRAKVFVNRLGVANDMVRPKPAPSVRPTNTPVRFGYMGRLHPTKGLVALAHALRAIPAGVAFEVEIRGPVLDGATRAFVRELQQIVDGDARVRFEPAVPHPDVPSALAGYDVLLCPSTWYENGPTVALEAQAAGTPVIGSRAGNLAEIIDDGVNGRLVAPGDVAAWSRAIAETAAEPHTIDRWRDHLPPVRTMDDVASEYLEMYATAS